MSAGSLIQAMIMFVVGILMLTLMLPVMNSTMTVMSSSAGLNATSSAQMASTFDTISKIMPLLLAAPVIFAVLGIASGMIRSVDESTTSSPSRTEVDTSRQLEAAARRTRTEFQQRNEMARPATSGTPQTKRQELMELDASALAPPIKVPAERPASSTTEATPQPVIEKPGKSRWESLE